MKPNLADALEDLIERVFRTARDLPPVTREFHTSFDREALFRMYCGEARRGLSLIAGALKPGIRILEVGSGSGLLAGFLAEQGHEIVGLEPDAASGFDHMAPMYDVVRRSLRADFRLTRASVVELDPAPFGEFDLIFSVNVLEHIPPIAEAFSAMASVLALKGVMLHTCPNYAFPYEPHFGIPLVPGFPALSRRLFFSFAMEQRLPGLWDSLNWIDVPTVRRLARQNSLHVEFDTTAMAVALRRLHTDPAFASRHGSWLATLSRNLEYIGAIKLIESLPPVLTTPMTFALRHVG
jgi:SAM-dependent methyltransferase